MKMWIYPQVFELKTIYNLIFKARSVKMKLDFFSNEALNRVSKKLGEKESVSPFLPPVVITEIDGDRFKTTIRSDHLFGRSLKFRNSPELQAEIKNAIEGSELTATFNYTVTFRVKLFATAVVAMLMMLIGHILLFLPIFGIKEALIIGPFWILISGLSLRVTAIADMKSANLFEDVLIESIRRIFSDASGPNQDACAVKPHSV